MTPSMQARTFPSCKNWLLSMEQVLTALHNQRLMHSDDIHTVVRAMCPFSMVQTCLSTPICNGTETIWEVLFSSY